MKHMDKCIERIILIKHLTQDHCSQYDTEHICLKKCIEKLSHIHHYKVCKVDCIDNMMKQYNIGYKVVHMAGK